MQFEQLYNQLQLHCIRELSELQMNKMFQIFILIKIYRIKTHVFIYSSSIFSLSFLMLAVSCFTNVSSRLI